MGNPKVAFIGLGAMGWGMSTHLVRSGFPVVGYDISRSVVNQFVTEGGEAATNLRDAATRPNIKIFVCMVATSQQATSVFFDHDTGVVNHLPMHTTILLCITASPEYVMGLRRQIDDYGRSDLGLIDCPVSGGASRAADGTLTILASGSSGGLAAANSVLRCLSANLHIIPGNIGSGSKIKLVHQIFVGVNIAVACEVIGLAMLAGLDIKQVHDEIMKGDGASWLFGQRVPHMLALDKPPYSSLAIITKDMAMVTAYGRAHQYPLPLSSITEQIFLLANSAGWGSEDDCTVLRLYLLGRGNIKAGATAEIKPVSTSPLTLKTIHDLLVGVHLAATVEVVSFGRNLGIETHLLYEVIKDAAGTNAIFMQACSQIQDKDSFNLTTMAFFDHVRDSLTTAIEMAGTLQYPLPISSVALQQYFLKTDGCEKI